MSITGYPMSLVPTKGRECTNFKMEGGRNCSEVEKSTATSGPAERLHGVYLFLGNSKEPMRAIDVHVRRCAMLCDPAHNKRWVEGDAADPAGRELASRWVLPRGHEGGGSAQWLECSEGASHGRCWLSSSCLRAVAHMMYCHGSGPGSVRLRDLRSAPINAGAGTASSSLEEHRRTG